MNFKASHFIQLMLFVEVTLEVIRILCLVAANVAFIEGRVFIVDVFSVSNELALSFADKVTVSTTHTLAPIMCNRMPLQI